MDAAGGGTHGAAGDPLGDPAWDAFVQAAAPGSYLQLSGWARVKGANGWAARRVLAEPPDGRAVGAQVLVRRPRPLPWAFAYAPRGPVTTAWSPAAAAPFTEALRAALRSGADRVSHVRIDPEVERDGAGESIAEAFRLAGWRPAPPIQPSSTRVIDLRADEAALWSDLRKKWRQYVNRARSAGVTIEDAGAAGLSDFYRIYRETASRAGFLIRTEATYRAVWDAYAPHGLAQVLLARESDGEPTGALFLVRSGNRVVEPYGGMTERGAESRANYLLKWEAIRRAREAGAATYDLWGLAHAGIAHFKAGFGGREVRYIGALDLVLDPVGHAAYGAAQRARVWLARRRHGLSGGSVIGSSSEVGADA